ncbi:MAG TPA: hypothetical protein IAB39_08155 [Candidatus Onthovicinus excrementipullorum]|nr:hypothetical protein [Candidatus Onthovicinus excrementipullorum]
MGTIKIKNLSTLTDEAVLYRVADYESGEIVGAECPYDGAHRVNITKRGNTFTVTDVEDQQTHERMIEYGGDCSNSSRQI